MSTDESHKQLVLQRVRNRIIEHLEVLSSFDAQREYQKAVPAIYVPYELFSGWEDWVSEANPSDFGQPVFTDAECRAIETFHHLWDRVAGELPDDFPPFEQVLTEGYWSDLRDGAGEALNAFAARGKLPEDVLHDPL